MQINFYDLSYKFNILLSKINFYYFGDLKLLKGFLRKFRQPATRFINKIKIEKKIIKFIKLGLNKKKRKQKIIISLTSFPERMYDIHFTLYSLLNQSLKPDEVILWLGIEEFPNKEKDIPQSILNLKKNGLSIKWCKDIKSYKKLIPALKEYPDDIIVTADDDVYYNKNWLKLLYKGYLSAPDCLQCHRGHRIQFDKQHQVLPYMKWGFCVSNIEKSFLNFFTGAGGVLYPPNVLYDDFFREDLFMKLAPNGDDIWFWAMAVLNGIKINVVKNNIKRLIHINKERELGLNKETRLCITNLQYGGNDSQLNNVFDHYPELKEITYFADFYIYKKGGKIC